jgi:uncharacterized cupin superfamily protein
MGEKIVSKKNYNYLNQQPGVQLIKAGTYKSKKITNKSQIFDVPVSSNQMGYLHMQPGEEFEITYDFLEITTVLKGKIIVRDDQGEKYVAEADDVLIFTPITTVIFDAESDGNAICTSHRSLMTHDFIIE